MSYIVTLGKAGRFIIPKKVRESLGLRDGDRLRLESSEGKLEVTPEVEEAKIEMRDGFPVIVSRLAPEPGFARRAILAEREAREEQLAARHRKC